MSIVAWIRRGTIMGLLLALPVALAWFYAQHALDFSQVMVLSAISLALIFANLVDHQATIRRMCMARIEAARDEIDAGHLVVARNLLDEVDKLDQKNFEGRIARGELFRAEQNFDKARRQLVEALELQPDSYRAHFALAVTYLQEKKIYEAISEFNATLRLREDFAEAHYLLAQAHELMGEKDKAMQSYRHFLKLAGDATTDRIAKYAKVASERVKAMA